MQYAYINEEQYVFYYMIELKREPFETGHDFISFPKPYERSEHIKPIFELLSLIHEYTMSEIWKYEIFACTALR